MGHSYLSTVISDPLVVCVDEGAAGVALPGCVETGQVRLPAQLGVEGGLPGGPVQYSTVQYSTGPGGAKPAARRRRIT